MHVSDFAGMGQSNASADACVGTLKNMGKQISESTDDNTEH